MAGIFFRLQCFLNIRNHKDMLKMVSVSAYGSLLFYNEPLTVGIIQSQVKHCLE